MNQRNGALQELLKLTQLYLLRSEKKPVYTAVERHSRYLKNSPYSISENKTPVFKPSSHTLISTPPIPVRTEEPPKELLLKPDTAGQKAYIADVKLEEKPLEAPIPPAPPKEEYEAFFSQHFPSIKISKPSCIDPKLLDKTTILVLASQANELEKRFLEALKKALFQLGVPFVIDPLEVKENEAWQTLLNLPQLKLILAPFAEIRQISPLFAYYRKNTEEDHFIKHLSLVPLLPLKEYLQKAELKAGLWRELSTKLFLTR